MTDEEKQELEALKAKETLTDEETARVAELESLDISPDDEFDQAFDDALAADDPDTDLDGGSALDKKPKPKPKKGGDDSEGDDSSIFTSSKDPDPDPDQEGGDGDGDNPQAKIAKLEAELASNNQRMSSWEGRIKTANKAKEEAEAKLNGKISKTGKEDDTPGDSEEDAILSEFTDEFPSLEQPIKILVKKIARKMVDAQMGQIQPQIEEIQDATKEEAEQTHFEKIEKAHKDYLKIYDSGALNTWIETQPKFLQAGMKVVTEDGTAEEIIEMFDAYKKSVKHTQTVNHDNTKHRKLKGIEAVDQQPGGPPPDTKKAGKDDFDAAWDEALSKD